jgi:hypothetical protein
MNSSEIINELTREEWRSLGIYYERNESQWLLIGSRPGMRRFCGLLRECGRDSQKGDIGMHQHFGPYMYLELITWEKPAIGDHGIYGRPDDFERLAALIEEKLAAAKTGNTFLLDQEYSAENTFTLKFEIREDEIDPASLDPSLQ